MLRNLICLAFLLMIQVGREPALASTPARKQFGLPEHQLDFLLQKNRAQEAKKILAECKRVPGDEDVRLIWNAAILSSEDSSDEAVSLLARVKSFDDASDICLTNCAQAYAAVHDNARAESLSTVGIKRNDNPGCYEVRAACFMDDKRVVEAANDYERIARLLPAHAHHYLSKAASVYMNAHQPAKALPLAELAIKAYGGEHDPAVRLIKGVCLKELNRPREAIEAFTDSLRVAPLDKKTFFGQAGITACLTERAKCYQQIGDGKKAQADLKAAEKRGAEVEDFLFR